ncbi:MAG: energy transducer TonB [Pyrinomonadaceae bacterium]
MKKLSYLNRLLAAVFVLFILSAISFAQNTAANSGRVLNSRTVKIPQPIIPPAARALHASGPVNVQITIDELGNVISATAISGHPLLRKAAENAAMQAEFKPFMRGGKAVKTSGVLSYNFVASANNVASASNVTSANNNEEKVPTIERSVEPVPGKTKVRTADGEPTAEEIKEMLEEQFTSIYEDHFCCKEKNKVEFEWLAPVEVGGQRTLGGIPVPCWVANIDVKVTFTKQSSGETKSVRRGINGSPVKQGFCIYKGAYDEWTYTTYAP